MRGEREGGRRRPKALARRAGVLVVLGLASAILAAWPPARAEALDQALKDKLAASPYVYISSQRKDGSFGKPAEIWFLFHQDAVWVGTPPTTWRVKRIKAGRRAAKIAVGSVDGPSFVAEGSIVSDPKVLDVMYATYAKKYPDRWPAYAQRFRDGMKDGSRVLVRYTPTAERPAGASPSPPAPQSSKTARNPDGLPH